MFLVRCYYEDGMVWEGDDDVNPYRKDKTKILHRLDGPAEIYNPYDVAKSGSELWYRNGKPYREDGPCIDNYGRNLSYYDNHKLREDSVRKLKELWNSDHNYIDEKIYPFIEEIDKAQSALILVEHLLNNNDKVRLFAEWKLKELEQIERASDGF